MKLPTFESKRLILGMLAPQRFISGEEIGAKLSISRAAVAKHIRDLNCWGVDIFSVKGKGYRLARPLEMLDEGGIRSYLAEHRKETPIHLFPVIDSTNRYWMERYQQLPPSGSCCLAEMQTAGRGRRGRSWHSPFASSLYMSVYWFSDKAMAELMGLSLAIGLEIAQWLEQFGIADVTVKWPNDIYIGGEKVAGILIEMAGESDGHCHLVVGVGLNLELPADASEQIDQAFTDLARHLNPLPGRNQLAAGLLNATLAALHRYHQQGMDPVVERWQQYDHFAGKPVRLLMGGHAVEGVARGINHQGALQVETAQGIRPYYGGEISVRGADKGERE